MLKRTHEYLIGFDPGTDTGFATWHRPSRSLLTVESMKIHRALQVMLDLKAREFNLFLRIEDARKRTWFGRTGPEVWKGAGSIMRDCAIWQAFLEDFGIEYELVPPKHVRTKTTHDYFTRLTGWSKLTNEHGRDAAMLVYGY